MLALTLVHVIKGGIWWIQVMCLPLSWLQWGHNEPDGVSNNRCFGGLLNRLFRRRSKKTSKLRVTGLCAGIHRWPVNYPQKGPVARKMLPFDDVIDGVMDYFTGNRPGASKVTLVDVEQIDLYQTTAKQNKTRTLCMFLGMYYTFQKYVGYHTSPIP